MVIILKQIKKYARRNDLIMNRPHLEQWVALFDWAKQKSIKAMPGGVFLNEKDLGSGNCR